MSGEFREIYCASFMHSALAEAALCGAGDHPVSQALQRLYAAVAPIERGAAWFEASDSGWSEPAIALVRARAALRSAWTELDNLAGAYEEVARGVLERPST